MGEQIRLKRQISVSLQKQRVEEHLAKLLIPDPWLSIFVRLKRGCINKGELSSNPLKIERGRVLQNQIMLQSLSQQFQLKESGLFEHLKGPLKWIRNDRDSFVFQYEGVIESFVIRKRHLRGLYNF